MLYKLRYIIFYYYPLDAFWFSNDRKKWGCSRTEGRCVELEGEEGWKTEIMIYTIRKNYFQQKKVF